ncbi:MAG: 3-keto-disaccharide hydrolase, partial [Longimicrobiales bacterium]
MIDVRFNRVMGLTWIVCFVAMSVTDLRAQEAAMNTLTEAEQAAGWTLLFDGETMAGWRGYMMDSMPEGWDVVDGALVRVGPTRDIITTEIFRDFELSIDWNVDPGGNSGIFYRAVEGPEQIYFAAPEMQVLDDA